MKTRRIIIMLLISSFMMSCFGVTVVNAKSYFDESTFVSGAILDERTPVLDASYDDAPSAPSSLPSYVDLSNSVYFPQVRSQGRIGSCTAWATTYYQFGYQVAKLNNWNAKTDASKQFSPRWTHNILNGGLNKGIAFSNAYNLLQKQGAVRFSQFPSSGENTSSEYRNWYLDKSGMTQALEYRVVRNQHLSFADNSADTPIYSPSSVCLSMMKNYLYNGYVLTYTTDFGEWDCQKLTSQTKSTLNGQEVCIKQFDSNNHWDGHAMAIVGYDDGITYDLNGDGAIQNYEKGAFKVVNSHGTDYGNGGFMWVMYDALNRASNTSVQNVSTRRAIFDGYSYDVIEVAKYTPEVLLEVKLNQKYRNDIALKLGNSDASTSKPVTSMNTMLYYNGGTYNFSGTGTNAEDAVFVFDFGNLFSLNSVRKNYYVTLNDRAGGNSTIVKNIILKDKSNKTIVNDVNAKTINGTTVNYKLKLGTIGDVDNNGRITIADNSAIQRHLAGITTLSDEEKKVADTDGNGSISIKDASYIQDYLAGNISSFPNGFVALLG